jgi:Toastrack DUF4097
MPSTPEAPPVDDREASDPTYDTLLRRRNLFGAIAAFFFVLVVISGVLDETTSVQVDRSFPVGAAPRLVLHDGVSGGLRGGIEVHVGASDRILVQGKVHGTWRVQYVLQQHGDDVVIDVQSRSLLGWLAFLGPARFTVTAPAATKLDIDTRAAAIDIQGIVGGGSVRTSNGMVRLDGDGGHPFKVSTSNGAITATGFDGSADFETTNGAITVQGGRGSFVLTTTNGAVVLDAELLSTGQHKATTTNGAVTVRLRGEPSLRIDAHTTNGAVVVNRSITVTNHQRNVFTGTIGAGTGELVLRTTNGQIVIE